MRTVLQFYRATNVHPSNEECPNLNPEPTYINFVYRKNWHSLLLSYVEATMFHMIHCTAGTWPNQSKSAEPEWNPDLNLRRAAQLVNLT